MLEFHYKVESKGMWPITKPMLEQEVLQQEPPKTMEDEPHKELGKCSGDPT